MTSSQSARSVIKLANATLQSAAASTANNSKNPDATATLFRELALALTNTSPPPPTPRVPDPPCHIRSTKLEKQLNLILKSAGAAIMPAGPLLHRIKHDDPLELGNTTYGTTPPSTIHNLLDAIYPESLTESVAAKSDRSSSTAKTAGMFVDAGSGMGLPPLAAALSNRFDIALGIEYEEKWHAQALLLKDAYEELGEVQNRATRGDPRITGGAASNAATALNYVCNDMAIAEEEYFSGATFIFANSVTWNAQLCRKISLRIEKETAPDYHSLDVLSDEGTQPNDVFVVSMSRTLALPSFDLVDILSMNANGGMFNFYVNRRSKTRPESRLDDVDIASSRHFSMSDSPTMRQLRESKGGMVLKDLIQLASGSSASSLTTGGGLHFLAAISASEPSVRAMIQDEEIWSTLILSIRAETDLPTRALGSMVFRALVDHAVGRRAVSERITVVDSIIAAVGRKDEHPVVRANLLDILSNVLCDSPLDHVSLDVDNVLATMKNESERDGLSDITQALEETLAIRRWWKGEQRTLPDALLR